MCAGRGVPAAPEGPTVLAADMVLLSGEAIVDENMLTGARLLLVAQHSFLLAGGVMAALAVA